MKEATVRLHNSFIVWIFAVLATSCSLSGKIVTLPGSSGTTPSSSSPYQLLVNDKVVPEYGIASLTVNLTQAFTQDVTFNYYTQNNSATSGVDYIGVSGSATIAAGQTQATVFVSINDNYTKTANKSFYFNITGANSVQIGSSSSLIQIQDDDFNALTGVQQMSGGGSRTCIVNSAGGAQCWGTNFWGLGDGVNSSSITAINISGLTSGVASISAGALHTCALTTSGGVKCWGANYAGQLGNGTTTASSTPVDVSGLTSGVTAVSAGGNHACALTTGGGVKCWGSNGSGELGDGSTTQRTTPVDVSGLTSGVAAITLGGAHSCAIITATGGLKCWGYNAYGQVGDGSTTSRNTPVDVTGLTSGVAAVSLGGESSCALTTSGGMRCWGRNIYSQLGDGTTTQRTTSVNVTGLTSGVSAISVGDQHACALTTSGGMKCWGRNSSGQVGDNSTSTRTTPVDVSGLTSGVLSILAATNTGSHSCALVAGNEMRCWGDNASGQLGDGFKTLRPTPSDVSIITSGLAKIINGGSFGCAITTAGGAKCWGYNGQGQLGDGTTVDKLTTAVDVSGLTSGVSDIYGGDGHSCVLTTSGGVKCWGQNSMGQLGDGSTTTRTTPVDVTGLTSGAVKLASSSLHSCAVTSAGALRCWGYNNSGQLGDGTTTNRSTAVTPTGLSSGVVAVGVANDSTCAVMTTGALRCWGANTFGQLGDGTTTARTTPTNVSGLSSGIVAVATGERHTCALTSSGTVKCWGNNAGGYLGDGTATDSSVPVDIPGLNGVSALATNNVGGCVLTTAGGVKCWGTNYGGTVGDGTFTQRNSPVDVAGMTFGVSAISTSSKGSASSNAVCAITIFGNAKCWGSNNYNQISSSYNTWIPRGVAGP
jgi:alpha-tubulin suppressor-like RCC1 family protein